MIKKKNGGIIHHIKFIKNLPRQLKPLLFPQLRSAIDCSGVPNPPKAAKLQEVKEKNYLSH